MAIHPEPIAWLIDGCTGSGMLGLAVKIALGGLGGHGGGIRSILNIERETYSAATLVARMEEATLDKAPVWDVFEYAHCPPVIEYLRRFRDKPIIFTAGYPCQGFSLAGKRLGEEDERFIWPHIAEFIGAVRPDIVFLENVPGHLALGFARVRRDLETRGYRVTRGLFSAAEVGASHERARLFILAVADDQAMFRGAIERGEQDGILPEMADSNGINDYNRGYGTGQDGGKQPEQAGLCGSQQSGILADSGGGQLPEPGRGSRGRTGPGSASQDVADSRRKGLEKRGFKPGDTIQELEAVERSGGELADSERHRRGQGAETFFQGTGESVTPDESETIPLFAPGPGELGEWARIIGIDWTLEPALCRIPDGYAIGMDICRLRITGNGVAPIQAAYAFVTLWAAIEYGQGF